MFAVISSNSKEIQSEHNTFKGALESQKRLRKSARRWGTKNYGSYYRIVNVTSEGITELTKEQIENFRILYEEI